MAFKARQITLVANTITPLLVAGSTGTQFAVVQGTLQDPLPVRFSITSGTVYWGGPDVSATQGELMIANAVISLALYGMPTVSDIPYVFSTGTPVVTVLVGRQ